MSMYKIIPTLLLFLTISSFLYADQND